MLSLMLFDSLYSLTLQMLTQANFVSRSRPHSGYCGPDCCGL